MANNLIIGLGGTGGAILAELRKRIFSETGKKENPSIAYLYVDSSNDDLNDTTKWRYLGEDLSLAPSQKICIHGMNAAVMQNPLSYPGIAAFLNERDRELMKNDQVMSIISAGIGGQRRRFGRMLMANNIGTPDNHTNFVSRLNIILQSLQHNGDGEVKVHLCAGLAGGTGSGSFVDVIAQINKAMAGYPAEMRQIYCYLYIPEVLVDAKSDSGFYHANGYAALSELNAMLLNQYCPTDASGQPDVETGKVQRLLKNGLPINSAYIFSNMNEDSRVLQRGEKLSSAVADFLYQKICGGISESFLLAENDGTAAERNVAGVNVHARNFLSFGIKRIVYPEIEIKEYVAYSYAKQAALQLVYNKWVAGNGFEEISMDEVGLGYQTEIGKAETLERLKLNDARLTLQTPIKDIKDVTDNWETFSSYWDTITNFFATDAKDDGEKSNWQTNFLTSCEAEFHSNFRGVGVKKFFETQAKEIKGYAAFVSRHIESMLFGEWKAGGKSLLEAEKYVRLLINSIPDRITKYDDRIAETRKYIEQEILPEIAYIEHEWNNIGWLKDAITGASKKVFDKYRTIKCDHYVALTEIASFEFAKLLLQDIQEQLSSLQKSIEKNRENIDVVLKNVAESAEAKCKIPTVTQQNAEVNVVDKRYDPERIREIVTILMRDEAEVQNLALQVREAIIEQLTEDKRNFGALAGVTVNISGLTERIIGRCITTAESVLKNYAISNENEQVLNVNILEKIKQQYNTDELLTQYVKNIVAETKVFTQFDQSEVANGYQDPTAGACLKRHYSISLPKYDDPTNFRDKLIQTFVAQCPGLNKNDAIVSEKDSQITFISCVSVIPLRFIQNVKFLEQKYKQVTSGPLGELNKVLLHTESFSKPLPPLFEASVFEKEIERRPYAIILHSLGVIEEKTDPESGATVNMLGIGSGFNRKWIKLGRNMDQTLQRLVQDEVAFNAVSEYVDNLLNTEYKTNAAKAKLRENIENSVCSEILPLCNNNELGELFVKYRKAAEALFNGKLADKY